MEFQACIAEQFKRHPSMTPQDLVKLCYQAAFGAEHLLADKEKALRYLEREWEQTPPSKGPLYEEISPEICRVDLGAWKGRGFLPEWLFFFFAASCTPKEGAREVLAGLLDESERLLTLSDASFSIEAWRIFRAAYENAGMPPMHHSETYRRAEKPAYRIVKLEWTRYFPDLERLLKGERVDSLPEGFPLKGES